MKTTWSLDELYHGFDDPQYASDLQSLTQKINAFAALTRGLGQSDPSGELGGALTCMEEISVLSERLAAYAKPPIPAMPKAPPCWTS